MTRILRIACLIGFVWAGSVPAGADLLSPGSLVRISRTAAGTDANGPSVQSAISADGRVVAFTSKASDLVAGDTNGVADTFVRDLNAGTIERVSLLPSGEESSFGVEWPSDISADGRWVAFSRYAPSSADDEGVFLHDRMTRTTTRISVRSDGQPFRALRPSVSGDGSSVAMMTFRGEWLWTRATGSAREVVHPVTGQPFEVDEHDLSADGSTLVFVERFPWGISAYDLVDDTVERIGDDSFSHSMSVSADGRTIGFLRVREGAIFADIVVFDRDTATASVLLDAAEAMGPARMASDGRHVVFGSIGLTAAAPVPGAWIWDRVTNQTRFASFDSNGVPVTAANQPEAVSHDASAFTWSTSSALEPDDENGMDDVFVRDARGACKVACVLPS